MCSAPAHQGRERGCESGENDDVDERTLDDDDDVYVKDCEAMVGFQEVRGVTVSLAGERVPPYTVNAWPSVQVLGFPLE